jgi:hypothetical protein
VIFKNVLVETRLSGASTQYETVPRLDLAAWPEEKENNLKNIFSVAREAPRHSA